MTTSTSLRPDSSSSGGTVNGEVTESGSRVGAASIRPGAVADVNGTGVKRRPYGVTETNASRDGQQVEGIAAGDRCHVGGRDGGVGLRGCRGDEGEPSRLQAG